MFTSLHPSVTDVDICGAGRGVRALKVADTSVNFFLLSRKKYDIAHALMWIFFIRL